MRPASNISVVLFVLAFLAGLALAGLAILTQNAVVAPVFAAGGFMVGWFLSSGVRVVSAWERMLVLRLGKLHTVADPGLRLIVPVIDSPIFVEMRVQTVDIARQQAITKDNVPVVVNGVVFFAVTDPASAALKVESYRQAISRLAQATLRDVVGRLMLDELLSHQERLESEIAQNVEVQSKAWGLHVQNIKLEDIDVPEDLKKMMSRQASSEREKRATIIKADGDRLAADALAQAAATMASSPGAMQLRLFQTLDGLGPSPSNTVVLALPMEIVEAMRAYVQVRPKAPGGAPST